MRHRNILWSAALAVFVSVGILVSQTPFFFTPNPQGISVMPSGQTRLFAPVAPVAPGSTNAIVSPVMLDPMTFELDLGTSPPTLKAKPVTPPPSTVIWSEIPTGPVDGTNRTYVLSRSPIPQSVLVFHQGHLLKLGIHYDLNGRNIDFRPGWAPFAGSYLLVTYTPL